jgi:hypothetical protein
MNTANDKYGASLDRPLGAGKPVDPATRLSELLAQSLEELTRPFDPPRPGAHQARPVAPREEAPAAAPHPEALPEAASEPSPEQARVDADKALADLEAELFAAAKQVDRDDSIPHTETHDEEHAQDHAEETAGEHPDRIDLAPLERALALQDEDLREHEARREDVAVSPDQAVPPLAPDAPPHDAAASAVIAKVRRLMLISMAVTVIAVGSVFGFIGYRIFKGEGSTEKRADKLPPTSPIPNDVTLSLPRGAKVIQSAVTNDRLVMTLEIDGKVEVRTFDARTLQPAGRLDFSATP